MKKVLLITALFASNVHASELESKIRVIDQFVKKFNYAVETKDYADACQFSRILERDFKDLAANVSGDARIEVSQYVEDQKSRTTYYCGLTE